MEQSKSWYHTILAMACTDQKHCVMAISPCTQLSRKRPSVAEMYPSRSAPVTDHTVAVQCIEQQRGQLRAANQRCGPKCIRYSYKQLPSVRSCQSNADGSCRSTVERRRPRELKPSHAPSRGAKATKNQKNRAQHMDDAQLVPVDSLHPMSTLLGFAPAALPPAPRIPSPERKLPRTNCTKSWHVANRKIGVISSKLSQFVSGKQSTENGMARADRTPNSNSMPPGPTGPAIIVGATKAEITFAKPQLTLVHKPTAFPRTLNGMISETYNQAPNPQDTPKANM
mmetsp:Transcript_31638/g.95636  ORF Transcript_31638/g.95636 Transcript_31638/m.95636 type:complete len:283 (+) Transcript_31638:34-882(+)